GPRDRPAGVVHLVDALVADVAVAEVPEPVPVVMHEVAVVRLLGRRPQPEVEVQLRRRLGDRLVPDAPARLAAVALGDEQLAVLPGLDGGDLTGPAGVAPLLGAVLQDAAVLLNGLDAAAALADDVAHRLLDVDVLARLHAPDRQERVPVVGRGDRDRVEVLVVQRLADVLHAGRPVAALVPDL